MRAVFALLPLAGLAFGLALPQHSGHGGSTGGQTTSPSTRTGGGQTTTPSTLPSGGGLATPSTLPSSGGGLATPSTLSDPTNVTNDPTNGGRNGGLSSASAIASAIASADASAASASASASASNNNSPSHGNHGDQDPEDPDCDDPQNGHHSDDDDDTPAPYPICGGLPSPNAPTCDHHSVCIEDPLHPCGLSFACYGICVPKKAPKCGGFAGLSCPKGLKCVADTPLHGTASCDPRDGDDDCFGICI